LLLKISEKVDKSNAVNYSYRNRSLTLSLLTRNQKGFSYFAERVNNGIGIS